MVRIHNISNTFRPPPIPRSEENSTRGKKSHKLTPIVDHIENPNDHSLIGSSYFLKLPLLYNPEKGINIPIDLDINAIQNINIFNNIKNNTYNIYHHQRKLPSLSKPPHPTQCTTTKAKPSFQKIFNIKLNPTSLKQCPIPSSQE